MEIIGGGFRGYERSDGLPRSAILAGLQRKERGLAAAGQRGQRVEVEVDLSDFDTVTPGPQIANRVAAQVPGVVTARDARITVSPEQKAKPPKDPYEGRPEWAPEVDSMIAEIMRGIGTDSSTPAASTRAHSDSRRRL